MPQNKIVGALAQELAALDQVGTRKGRETVITGVIPPSGEKGPRYLLEGEGCREFLRMNSNTSDCKFCQSA